jgi:hypothetical protein
MANDGEIEDLGGLESTAPLAEDARAETEEQPTPQTDVGEDPVVASVPTGAGEDPVAADAPTGGDALAAAPSIEDPAAPVGPSQVAE